MTRVGTLGTVLEYLPRRVESARHWSRSHSHWPRETKSCANCGARRSGRRGDRAGRPHDGHRLGRCHGAGDAGPRTVRPDRVGHQDARARRRALLLGAGAQLPALAGAHPLPHRRRAEPREARVPGAHDATPCSVSSPRAPARAGDRPSPCPRRARCVQHFGASRSLASIWSPGFISFVVSLFAWNSWVVPLLSRMVTLLVL